MPLWSDTNLPLSFNISISHPLSTPYIQQQEEYPTNSISPVTHSLGVDWYL